MIEKKNSKLIELNHQKTSKNINKHATSVRLTPNG